MKRISAILLILFLNISCKKDKNTITTTCDVGTGNYTSTLIGTWQDENSQITYNSNGTFLNKWNTGDTASGTWAITGFELYKSFYSKSMGGEFFDIQQMCSSNYVMVDYYNATWHGNRIK